MISLGGKTAVVTGAGVVSGRAVAVIREGVNILPFANASRRDSAGGGGCRAGPVRGLRDNLGRRRSRAFEEASAFGTPVSLSMPRAWRCSGLWEGARSRTGTN